MSFLASPCCTNGLSRYRKYAVAPVVVDVWYGLHPQFKPLSAFILANPVFLSLNKVDCATKN